LHHGLRVSPLVRCESKAISQYRAAIGFLPRVARRLPRREGGPFAGVPLIRLGGSAGNGGHRDDLSGGVHREKDPVASDAVVPQTFFAFQLEHVSGEWIVNHRSDSGADPGSVLTGKPCCLSLCGLCDGYGPGNGENRLKIQTHRGQWRLGRYGLRPSRTWLVCRWLALPE
jgi:hypothetical protein